MEVRGREGEGPSPFRDIPRDRSHFTLGEIFIAEDRFSDAQAHIEMAKSHAIEGTYQLGIVMVRQAFISFQQSRLKDARSWRYSRSLEQGRT